MSVSGTRQINVTLLYSACTNRAFTWKVFALCASLCLSTITRGEEPARRFLDALAERGYHDTALEYLDWLERSKMVPAELQETIDFEQGTILLNAARRQQDTKVRSEDLAKARQRFESFLSQNAEHPRAVDAQQGLRQIKVELARGLMQQASLSDESDGNKKKLLRQAQDYFDEVAESYATRIQQIRADLERIRKGTLESDARDQLRAEYLQSKLMAATIAYEAAATDKSNEKKFKKRLDAADKQFEDISKKYRTWLAGILSVYYRGQIQQDLGNLKEALVFYEDHIGAMNEPSAFRNVAAKATTNAIQCWIHPRLKRYEKAIEVGERWIKAAQPADNSNPEWLALRMMVARAYLAAAESESGSEADSLRTQARKTAQFVARFYGPNQAIARRFVADLGGPVLVVSNTDTGSFESARAAALQARQELNHLETVLSLQKSKQNEDRSETEVAATTRQRDQQMKTTLQLHERAIELSSAQTDIVQLTDLQFYRCYLLYKLGRYYEAAVLGDHIATNHSDSGGARTAANIALASYATIQNQSTPPKESQNEVDFVRSQLESLADHIVQTWPGQKETDEALITLVSFMVRDERFDQATEYLNKIPDESPRRADAEIRTGQALWASYLRAAADDPPQSDELKSRARSLLKSGIDRMKKSKPTPALVRAVLSLSQVYLDTNKSKAAVELLENKQFGPKTLADKKSNLVMRTPGLSEQIYRAALRGYIGTSSLKDLNTTMAALGESVDDSPQGQRRLVGIYMALARDLQTQIQLAPAKDQKHLSLSFDKFLSEVSSTTKDFNILNWVALTYSNMGDEFNSGKKKVSATAEQFYDKSASTYDRILSLTDEGAITLDSNLLNTVRMRLASTQSRLGKYDEAIATFTDILSESNNMLNVQVEAARVLQAGANAGRSQWYRRAVMGDPRGQGTKGPIWGWGKISKVVAMQMYRGEAQKKLYSDTFYEARLQMAQCQLSQAVKSSGEKKAKYLTNAKRVVKSTAELYPDLGGPKWKKQYAELYADIQTELGEPPTSL